MTIILLDISFLKFVIFYHKKKKEKGNVENLHTLSLFTSNSLSCFSLLYFNGSFFFPFPVKTPQLLFFHLRRFITRTTNTPTSDEHHNTHNTSTRLSDEYHQCNLKNQPSIDEVVEKETHTKNRYLKITPIDF